MVPHTSLLVSLLIALFIVPLIFTRLIKPLLRLLLRAWDFFSNPQARQSLVTDSPRSLLRRMLREDAPPPVFTPTVRTNNADENAALNDVWAALNPSHCAEDAIAEAMNALQNGKAQVYTGADLKNLLGSAGNTKVFSTVTVNGKNVPIDSSAVSGLLQAVGASLSNASTSSHMEADASVERDVGERMRTLQELLRRGVITQAEFDAKKADILRAL